MKRKKLSAYLNQETKKANKALHNFLKDGEPEHLHHFRVEVKKLRALITLEESAGVKLNKSFKPIKALFKQAGIIRDNHLQLELSRKQEADMEFVQRREQEMQQADQALRKTIRRHPRRIEKASLKLARRLQPLTNLHLGLFYEQELLALAGELQNPASDDALHDCRKRLKVLIYNYVLIGSLLQLPFNQAYLEEVQAVIGTWHDNLLASADFPELQEENERLRAQIQELTADFYNQATTTTDIALEQID